MVRVITYNVNGIRSALRKGFLDWLEAAQPDILCIQETKAQPEQIPLFDFEILGYHVYVHSAVKKGYSGVAILSKKEPDRIQAGMEMPVYDSEGRFLRVDFGDISFVSVYHPSGSSGDERQDFKMQWLQDFQEYITDLRNKRPFLVVSGDYNICHRPIDLHDPVRNAGSSGFLPEERAWMSGFMETGFVDSFRYIDPSPHQYSWWSYRANARANNKGWRIDYNMVTENLADKISRVAILSQAKHSDHCPVLLELDLTL